MNWLPIEADLTPHGLRHSHKSLMVELRTPEVLSHERLGHVLGGIGGVYSHTTPAMRAELCADLTRCWEEALDARAAMCPRSPVAVLDTLLEARAGKKKGDDPDKIVSQNSPGRGILPVRSRSIRGGMTL